MKTFRSLKGHFLLDSGQLRGSYFAQSVILICQHDEDGALGLVLNRQLPSKLEEGVSTIVPDEIRKLPLFEGGPVEPGVFTFLHSDQLLLNANVMPNLSIGHSLEALAELGHSYSNMQQVKVFAGYSGWGAGQLEGELDGKAWFTCAANIEQVFQTDPDDLWKKILRDLGWQQRLLADSPEDLSSN